MLLIHTSLAQLGLVELTPYTGSARISAALSTAFAEGYGHA
ncbi:hypothetical protein LCGC14_1500970 [marine sediment metagenome]|uniref:Uncharacterized protein n=1 Tax=marine sediment metagenome TaxID=412755 RepID=A0A0F9LJT7_9ZZZZ